MHTSLSNDFDGAIFLHQVHGAELDFLPRPLNMAVGLVGWIYQHAILGALISLMLVAGLGQGGLRFLRRRKKSRSP